jgi:glutamyl-tRNA reductase
VTEQGSAEERAERAEEALRVVLEERNRLWHELQERRSAEQDVAYWRERASDIERSRWWRAGFPLRYVKRFLEDPAGMLEGRAHAIRRRRRGG